MPLATKDAEVITREFDRITHNSVFASPHHTPGKDARIPIPCTGGIAQLVERQLCKLDVRGSNPLASTDKAVSDPGL
jgi:hypothetical protein